MLNYIDKKGKSIRPFEASTYFDPSAGITLHIHTSDTNEDFILGGLSAIDGKFKLNAGGSLEQFESFAQGMFREYAEEMFYGFEHADADLLFPKLKAKDISLVYLNDKNEIDPATQKLKGYVRAVGLGHVTMTRAKLDNYMAALHANSAAASAMRQVILDNEELFPAVAVGAKGEADKKSKFYVSNLKYQTAQEKAQGKDVAAREKALAELERISQYTEYTTFQLFACDSLIEQLAMFDANDTPNGDLTVDGKKISGFAAKDVYPLLKFDNAFKEFYGVKLAQAVEVVAARKAAQKAALPAEGAAAAPTYTPAANAAMAPQAKANVEEKVRMDVRPD